MKNKMLCRLMSLGAAVLLMASNAAGGMGAEIYGAEIKNEETGISMTQSAVWTDQENFCGELSVEISGLKEWIEAEKEKSTEEIPGAITATPIPLPTEIPAEEKPTENTGSEKDEEMEETEETSGMEPVQEEVPEQEEAEKTMEDKNEEAFSGEADGTEGTEETEDESGEAPAGSETKGEAEDKQIEGFGEDTDKDAVAALQRGCGRIARNMSTEAEWNKISQVMLITRISRYFQVNTEKLPKDATVQEMMFPGEDGGLEAGTEVTCPIDVEELGDGAVIFKIPIILKEEYRYNEAARTFPVHCLFEGTNAETTELTENTGGETGDNTNNMQTGNNAQTEDGGLLADGVRLSGAGTFLVMKTETQTWLLCKEASRLLLEAAAAPADYTLAVKADTETPKAGQTLTYRITVANTGAQPLPLVSLDSSINPEGLNGSWADGSGGTQQETDVTGQKAILTNLKKGERRELLYKVKLPESQTEPVICTVTASAQKTGDSPNTVVRGTSLKTAVTPLKIDFTVNKSANRTTAAPGDTVTYQICIRNTGERTLHSVVSTERFQAENISAVFVEKEGVMLNSTKTQAMISEIPPGEVFSLEATVTLPQDLKAKELINQVLVKTKETGEKLISSTAGVKILSISPTPVPADTSYDLQNDPDSGASPVSDYPKTSDDSKPVLWAGVLCLALAVTGALWCAKAKRKH